jgi:DNA-binding IclR family transcriptional regulator
MMAGARSRAGINSSSAHVFTVLRLIAGLEEAQGVTEISRQLSLPASTVHRALVTLEEAGYIQRFRNVPKFELGTMPHLLNRALVSLFALHSAARDLLKELAQDSGETVAIWARLGWYAVRIAGAYGSHDVYHWARLGEALRLHETPAGRAILGALPEAERSAYATFAGAAFEGDMSVDTAVALRDADGAPAYALAIDVGDVDAPGARLAATRDALELMLAAEPERFRSPFAHLAPDEIKLDLPIAPTAQL